MASDDQPRAGDNRVRVVPSYLLQGSYIEGEKLDEGSDGITVKDDRGIVRFLPWTSVGYVVRNPEEIVDDPF